MLKHKYLGAVLIILAASCSPSNQASDFTRGEIRTIEAADSIMRVLTIDDPADCLVLRAPSHDLSDDALLSSDYEKLTELMVATVTHPSQDGVGIAGPQVGLNRRVVAVQRFDKEPVLRAGRLDHPFEVYPNIRIVWASDSLEAGPEGCLSVPDRRGDVMRSTEIIIEYADLSGCKGSCGPDCSDCESCSESSCHSECAGCCSGCDGGSDHADSCVECSGHEGGKIPMVREKISGFTAVIFQHEIDHLDGVLYIDRLSD
jgi:peptide deformylase